MSRGHGQKQNIMRVRVSPSVDLEKSAGKGETQYDLLKKKRFF